ncbi:hypothetical protein ABT160_44110 [Streptomyces sp. NPDC001941]|uniref:terpene synthase family protein n=1 Tax=Streptomyces sp. NPDC001941 TaxID=3154659 RepID=UPI00333062FD
METPWLDRRYPVRQSPYYRSVVDEFHQWFLSFGLYDTDEKKQAFVAKDYPYLVSVAWPGCDRERLMVISAVAAALTERDDEGDANRSGASLAKMRASLADARNHQTTMAEPRWGPLFTEIWRRLQAYSPPGQMARLADMISAHIGGCIAYDEKLVAGEAPSSVKDYVDVRFFSIGQLVDHVLIEISLGIDIGGVLDDPLMRELARCDVERVISYQDILSLRKDLAEGETENLVHVFASELHCSLPQAMTAACAFFEEKMRRFDEVADEVKASPLGRRPDVRLFVDGLNDFTSGLIEWTSCSARYTLRSTSEWVTPTVPFTRADQFGGRGRRPRTRG